MQVQSQKIGLKRTNPIGEEGTAEMKPAALSILLLAATALLELPQMKCGSPIKMDLAVDALDDQYDGCRNEMLNNVKNKYFPSELAKTTKFKDGWQKAKINVTKLMKNNKLTELSLEQATATYLYTMDDVYSAFNTAVRTGGTNYMEFPFKALHFHLTDALKTLRSKNPTCYNVYRGVKRPFTAVEGKTVRFGQFASASLNQSVAEGFGNATLFTIRTCLGVPIKKYSEKPKQEEVLIPPFEAFKVMEVKGNLIKLTNADNMKSNFNCLGVKKKCSCLKKLCCLG